MHGYFLICSKAQRVKNSYACLYVNSIHPEDAAQLQLQLVQHFWESCLITENN